MSIIVRSIGKKGIQCSIDAIPNTLSFIFHIFWTKFLHKLLTTFHVDRKNETINDNCKCKSILCFLSLPHPIDALSFRSTWKSSFLHFWLLKHFSMIIIASIFTKQTEVHPPTRKKRVHTTDLTSIFYVRQLLARAKCVVFFGFFFSALVQQLIKKCFVQMASFTRQMFCFYRFHIFFLFFFFINAIGGKRCENQTQRNLWSQHCTMCKLTSFTQHSRKKNVMKRTFALIQILFI